MTRARIAGGVFAAGLVLLALGVGYRALQQYVPQAKPASPVITSSTTPVEKAHPSVLYGRITTNLGATYEGRLRWGGDQEAFWGDYFNGAKKENLWAAQVPIEHLPKERNSVKIFGLEIGKREVQTDLGRLFMARFGDIARIEAVGRSVVRVTLKSGTVFDLQRSEASDFDDGVRVWDGQRGVRDLDSLEIRTIELLAAGGPGVAPVQLHGTVRTRQGDFTGFVQWNRNDGVGSDELDGRSDDRELSLRFDTIRSIARRGDSSLVTLLDGREMVLSGTREAGRGNLGIYVDDRRYGRVLISWDAFERVDFSAGGSGPDYSEFPPGRPLAGSVTTRAGRRLAGRLVYDLDESETTETLDAPSAGVDYTILFGLIASIEAGAQRVRVTLHNGEQLQLDRTGDLGERNAGMLIFVDGQQRPEYVPWTDIQRVDFDRPPAMYPPLGTSRAAPSGRR